MSKAIRQAGRLNGQRNFTSPICENCEYWQGKTTVWGTCSAPLFAELVKVSVSVQLSAFGNDQVKTRAVIQTKKTFGCLTFANKNSAK